MLWDLFLYFVLNKTTQKLTNNTKKLHTHTHTQKSLPHAWPFCCIAAAGVIDRLQPLPIVFAPHRCCRPIEPPPLQCGPLKMASLGMQALQRRRHRHFLLDAPPRTRWAWQSFAQPMIVWQALGTVAHKRTCNCSTVYIYVGKLNSIGFPHTHGHKYSRNKKLMLIFNINLLVRSTHKHQKTLYFFPKLKI